MQGSGHLCGLGGDVGGELGRQPEGVDDEARDALHGACGGPGRPVTARPHQRPTARPHKHKRNVIEWGGFERTTHTSGRLLRGGSNDGV